MGWALPSDAPGATAFQRRWPLGAVALAVGFGLVELAPEVRPVAYLNDSSVHAQMARYATAQLRAGHFPLDGWWPYLGLGSPQFLHYQGLGSLLTGIAGLATGPTPAFTWSLYVLLATWPVSVYCGARLFGLARSVAGVAALVSPLVTSRLGIGYEQTTYLWIGFGLTTQLFAMWTLPLAWGATWRAVHTGRQLAGAAALTSLTVALHFMTGYLALAPIALWPFLSGTELRRRVGRAAALLAGSFLGASFVIVPVLAQARWASVNEFLAHTPIADSYGARQVLSWLAGGSLLDWNRFPVLTLLALAGALTCLGAARRDERARAVLLVTGLSLVLFFGRPTLGPLMVLIPGHTDLFLRRFLMGLQLGAILLAGIGAVALGGLATSAARRAPAVLARRGGRGDRDEPVPKAPGSARADALALAALGVLLGALYPAWHGVAARDGANGEQIAAQRAADASQGRELAALVSLARRRGPGRFYAGLPNNWGASFSVGAVPVFKYLERLDVDEVGYTLRTASLMTDPEAFFDENQPGDFSLFGIRYLVLPPLHPPPLPATFVARRGPYELWELPNNSYVQVIDTRGTLSADRTNVGLRTKAFLSSAGPAARVYPTVAFAGSPAAAPTLAPGTAPGGPAGTLHSEHADLVEGTLSAVVTATRRAVVLLAASYDPGWTVTVDGRPAATEMVAPALVGVAVGPGTHRVVFTYEAFGAYPELFALSGGGLVALGLAPVLLARLGPLPRRRRGPPPRRRRGRPGWRHLTAARRGPRSGDGARGVASTSCAPAARTASSAHSEATTRPDEGS